MSKFSTIGSGLASDRAGFANFPGHVKEGAVVGRGVGKVIEVIKPKGKGQGTGKGSGVSKGKGEG